MQNFHGDAFAGNICPLCFKVPSRKGQTMRQLFFRSSGLLLAFALAVPAWVLGSLVPLVGAPVFAILIGMILSFFKRPAVLEEGILVSGKFVLQYAIIFLGFSLDLGVVLRVGVQSLAVMIFTLSAAFATAYFVGKALRLDQNLKILIGVGTSICGGSAIAATAPVIEASSEDVTFATSVVKRGEAQCLVVNTGSRTSFGRTAELVQIARPKSHQEQIMLSIVRYMMFLGIAALAAVAADALLMKIGALSVVGFAVIFLMGAVPVALPAVLTIVQAVGAMELVRKGVLVTRLDSMEDAASLDVLCMDKTGTLTMNQLTVTEVIPYAPYAANDVLSMAALTSTPESKDGIDIAVRQRAEAAGHRRHGIPAGFRDPLRARHKAIRSSHSARFGNLSGGKGRPPGCALPCAPHGQRRCKSGRRDGGDPFPQGVPDSRGGEIPVCGRR